MILQTLGFFPVSTTSSDPEGYLSKEEEDMEKIKKKRKMLEAGIRKHQDKINDFVTRIRELKEENVVTNDQEGFQQPQRPYNEQVIPEENVIDEQLQFANAEMNRLQELKNNENGELHRQIGLGSVVETDKGTFYISASIEPFQVDGKEIIGISDQSPLFKALEGKQKGDTVSFKGTVYEIREVY